MHVLSILSTIQVILSLCVVIGLSILITGVLCCKETRTQPFLVYLVGLLLADLFSNLKLAIAHIWLCGFCDDPRFYLDEEDAIMSLIVNVSVVIFSTFVNMYLSAMVAYHIYYVLNSSYRAIRIKPITITRVLIEFAVVYIIGCSLSIAYCVTTMSSIANNQVEKDERIWAWCLLGLVTIPFIFLVCVTIRIWKRKLLPLSNTRTRGIAIYFARIVFVFIAFYIPGMIIFCLGVANVFVEGIQRDGLIKITIGTIIFALQGAFSCGVALTKPDILEAVRTLLRCHKIQHPPWEQEGNNYIEENARKDNENINNKIPQVANHTTVTHDNATHDTRTSTQGQFDGGSIAP